MKAPNFQDVRPEPNNSNVGARNVAVVIHEIGKKLDPKTVFFKVVKVR